MALASLPLHAITQGLYALHRRTVSMPRVSRVSRALAAQIGQAESILDVGCCDGQVASEIARRVGASRVLGVDIKVQPHAQIEVLQYDGQELPLERGAVEVVVLSDMLHHSAEPTYVLKEALRVASRMVAVKDHFCFGPLSELLLLAMDCAGNAEQGVLVRGTYFHPGEWLAMVQEAGGRVTGLEWPLQIHDYPFRLVTRDELQFAARIEHAAALKDS